jgi:hypothetical protein
MNPKRLLILALPWFLLILVGFIWYKQYTRSWSDKEEKVEVINHNMVIDKIEALGKLELVKFYLKDIVEKTKEMEWWRSDSKVVLMVSGEVVGCIDLTKIDSSDVLITGNELLIKLPQPEICYFKVNHQDSKVYNIETGFFVDEPELIDAAYKQAESQLEVAAFKMKIHDQTKANASLLLKPLLEDFTGKKVTIAFE